jgi:hypothetical protein
MKAVSFILMTVALFAAGHSFAHTDKIEKPIHFYFTFSNGNTLNMDTPSDSALQSISNDISSQRKTLKEAQVIFRNGEKVIFRYNQMKISEIIVNANNKQTVIPKRTIQQIPDVQFQTIGVLWDGAEKKPFSSGFYYIRFHIGAEKPFGSYPYVEFKFLDQNYTKALLWKQISQGQLQFASI